MDSVVEMCANTKMVHVQYKSKCFSLPDAQNGNDLPSPDSARSTSSFSNRSVESPPDVEMFECLSDSNSVEGDPTCPFLKSSPSPTGMVITDLHNGSYTQRIDNTRCVVGGSVDDGSSRASSPLLSSAGRSISESSSLPSCQSFSDCSMDRVLRSNSFCLQDSEQALSISYLAESAGSPATPSDLGFPSFREHGGTPKEQVKHLHLADVPLSPNNQTYFLDEYTGQSQSCLSVPGKPRGTPLVLLPSNVDVTPETCRVGPSVVKLLHSYNRRSSPFMTPADKTFVVPTSEDGDGSNVQTSTPVQSLSNKTFCLPALDESPFTKEPVDQGSSTANGIKHQPASATSKPIGVAKTATAAPKSKKFSKPDFSSVKSKIISRQASTQKSSNLPVVQASPFCSTKQKENQVQRQAYSAPNKPSTTSASGSSSSASPSKVALSKREAPPSGKQEKPPSSLKKLRLPVARPRLWSESASVPKSKADTQHQRGKTVPPSFISKVYKAVTLSRSASQKQQSKQGPQKGSTSSQEDALCKKAAESRSDRPKISPKTAGSKPALSASRAAVAAGSGAGAGAGAASEERKGRFGVQPTPGRERGAPASPATGVNGSRQPPNMARLRLGSNRGFSPSKDGQPPGHSRNALSNMSAGLGSGPLDAVSGVKQSPKRPLPPVTPSRIPTQPQGLLKNISGSSSTSGNNTQGYGETCHNGGRAAPWKASGLRPRLQTPAKSTTTTAVCKSSGSSNPTSIKPVSSSSTSKRLLPTRPVRTNTAQSVDKNKQRPNVRNPPQQQQQTQVNGHRDPAAPESRPQSVERYQAQCARSAKTIQELKRLLLESNCRFEAITVVLQHCVTEHDESLRKCGELSLELVNLREELVNTSQSCGRLEQEKEDLRAAFDGVLQKMQEQHRSDLADLEERLRTFYAAEWDKVHQVYQEEADKCKAQMEEQLENLMSKHEVLRKDLEAIHAEKMESIKQQYEQSLEELGKAHEAEMQTWDRTLKDTEVNLTGQIEELQTANSTLNEKLKEEERRREMFADSQKDSQTVYLEQELESLKVVLEIKNNQLHQQDKKLMQMDKVLEKNVKLDESLQKVQQENEDLRARMDKHVALSRQLSTEQAVLQENLQKESNVNKRLSMENEELLWKLHNGDISSPRKLSPSAPTGSLQSPRNSGIFSSPPVSPR